MAGDVPIGYGEFVDVTEPGVVRIKPGWEQYAASRDITPERIEYLMREPHG